MEQQDAEFAFLLVFCGYAAYRIMKSLWPIFRRCKGHPKLHMIQRATLAPPQETPQPAKYGSWKKTRVVNFGTAGMLLAWCYTATISPAIFLCLFGYLCVGFLVIHAFGIPKFDDLVHLNRGDRLWLRTFHAWLWPINALVPRKD